jgi:hypothetical protein
MNNIGMSKLKLCRTHVKVLTLYSRKPDLLIQIYN